MSAPSPPLIFAFSNVFFLMMIPSITLLTQIKAIGPIIPILSGTSRDMISTTATSKSRTVY
ncbi:hypothetical protein B0H17DRAFT_1201235 [Mycena rosella]|uniref:Uncharacterized protein n=1 Tax=Mycena rosella TaxID=1033263 RepID=A0AAD7GHG8_MYCRO|nr:hypothetical protein B0H17DRAFT_1201235 [Mycena rosella]